MSTSLTEQLNDLADNAKALNVLASGDAPADWNPGLLWWKDHNENPKDGDTVQAGPFIWVASIGKWSIYKFIGSGRRKIDAART